jgi:hypothetical protein
MLDVVKLPLPAVREAIWPPAAKNSDVNADGSKTFVAIYEANGDVAHSCPVRITWSIQ